MTTGTVKNGFDGWPYRLVELDFMGPARILGAAHAAVKALATVLFLLFGVSAAEPAGRLLTTGGDAPAGWQTVPPLSEMVWQPDLLLRTGSRTVESAAETYAARLVATSDAPAWIRLELVDLTAVGDCATCQPPPLDPHRYTPSSAPIALSPRQYLFFAETARRLAGTRLQPVVVVPPGGPPPEQPMPDNLFFLLAGRTDRERFGADALAARREQDLAWTAAGLRHANLIADGLGEFYGLPLNGDLLRQQAAALPHPAVAVRDAATYAAQGPDWLTTRLQDVLVAGQTTVAGDSWRADEPLLAAAVDVFAPVADQLGDAPAERLATVTLQALSAVRAWDVARAAGEPAGAEAVLTLLRQRHELRGGWEPAGTLSEAFADFLASAGPLPVVNLPPIPQTIAYDSLVSPDEWHGATALRLTSGRDGQPSKRPATVWLAAGPEGLAVAVIATEPDPADATLADRLVLRCDAGKQGLVVFEIPVGQPILRTVGHDGEPVPWRGVRREAGFDGPGWTLEALLTWSQLGFEQHQLRALAVSTEHRAGRLRAVTDGWPNGGAEWNPLRWPRVAAG